MKEMFCHSAQLKWPRMVLNSSYVKKVGHECKSDESGTGWLGRGSAVLRKLHLPRGNVPVGLNNVEHAGKEMSEPDRLLPLLHWLSTALSLSSYRLLGSIHFISHSFDLEILLCLWNFYMSTRHLIFQHTKKIRSRPGQDSLVSYNSLHIYPSTRASTLLL